MSDGNPISGPDAHTLLGERIQKAREAKGFTQGQLARRLGIKVSTLKNWESERSAPRANRLNMLAGVLDVPLLWLIAGSDSLPEVHSPELTETSAIESRLSEAENLINKLSAIITELRAQTRRVQRDFDEETGE